MWTGICVLVGIGCLMLGGIQQERNIKLFPASYLLGGALLLLALTLDPIGFLSRSLRDNNPIASDGSPNYWYNLNTGEKYHRTDAAVKACATNTIPIKLDGHDFFGCTIFGDEAGLLYPGIGKVQEIADAVANVRGPAGDRLPIVWPGNDNAMISWQNFGYDKTGNCIDAYAVDRNGHVLQSSSGLEYQLQQRGVWGEWFQRPDVTRKALIEYAQAMKIRTPDDLPRPYQTDRTDYLFVANNDVYPRKFLVCLGQGH